MAAQDQAVGAPTITFTDAAREKVLEIIEQQDLGGRGAIRIGIQGRGPGGFNYSMALEEDGEPEPGDTVVDLGEIKVLVDADTRPRVDGITVDFVGQLMGGGFRIDNPNSGWDDPTAAAVQGLIDTQINPGVASHGGHVELIDVKDDTVYVRLGGGCQGCGMVDVTLRQGIEALIKQELPQIKAVVDTTDHAGGNNPYFQPDKGGAAEPAPYYQPAKGGPGGGGGCGAPGCGAAAADPYYQPSKGGPSGGGGCGAPGCGAEHPYHQPSKG